MERPHRDRGGSDLAVIEAPHGSEPCWPAFDPASDTVRLLRLVPPTIDPGRVAVAWEAELGPGRAKLVFEYMAGRPEQWSAWCRMATLFGEDSIRSSVVKDAEHEAEVLAVAAEQERLDRDDRLRLHQSIDLFIHDPKGRRPGLSLQSGDGAKAFFDMRFSEKWERERILDWLRWQKPKFREFREVVEQDGAVALERLIIAGMRETEADVRKRGLSGGGRRPLRFWRGE